MPPYSREPHPDQGLLITDDGRVASEALPPVAPELATQSEPGASVNMADRAYELGETLKALNTANGKAGGQKAFQVQPLQRKMEQRYGQDTQRVRKGMEQSEQLHRTLARSHFDRAAGLSDMITAGVNEDEARRVVDEAFEDFTSVYGVGVTDAKVRNAKAKEIKKSARIITGQDIE